MKTFWFLVLSQRDTQTFQRYAMKQPTLHRTTKLNSFFRNVHVKIVAEDRELGPVSHIFYMQQKTRISIEKFEIRDLCRGLPHGHGHGHS